MSRQRNRRNTRRGRAKRWMVLVSQSSRYSERMHRGDGLFFGVSVVQSLSHPGKWRVVWYEPDSDIGYATHRREAFQVAEAIIRGRP